MKWSMIEIISRSMSVVFLHSRMSSHVGKSLRIAKCYWMFIELYYATYCTFFSLTGSMDLSIAFQSCPPHVSVILSVVRVLPSLHPLTEIYLKFVFAFIMPQCCLQESVWEYLTLVIAMQGQSVAVSAHHRPLPPQRRRADEVLLPGVPLFYA